MYIYFYKVGAAYEAAVGHAARLLEDRSSRLEMCLDAEGNKAVQACMYTCVYMYIYGEQGPSRHACIHVYICIYMGNKGRPGMHVYMQALLWQPAMYVHMQALPWQPVQACLCIFIYKRCSGSPAMHVYINTCRRCCGSPSRHTYVYVCRRSWCSTSRHVYMYMHAGAAVAAGHARSAGRDAPQIAARRLRSRVPEGAAQRHRTGHGRWCVALGHLGQLGHPLACTCVHACMATQRHRTGH